MKEIISNLINETKSHLAPRNWTIFRNSFTWLNVSIPQILDDTHYKARKNHLRHQEKVSRY